MLGEGALKLCKYPLSPPGFTGRYWCVKEIVASLHAVPGKVKTCPCPFHLNYFICGHLLRTGPGTRLEHSQWALESAVQSPGADSVRGAVTGLLSSCPGSVTSGQTSSQVVSGWSAIDLTDLPPPLDREPWWVIWMTLHLP